MTAEVKNFLEVNVDLLDTNPNEFFHWAYNGLSFNSQKELIDILHDAKFDIEKHRENVIRYIITRKLEDVSRPIYLSTFIDRYLLGILGYDYDWLLNYILDNESEWDDDITFNIADNGQFMIFPTKK